MPEKTDLLYLSDETLAGLGIETGEIIAAIEGAIAGVAANRVWAAPKIALLPGDGRYTMATLAVSDATGLIAVKTASVSPGNKARGLPAINASMLILDAETGLLKAVMGGNWVTGVRTAGLSAVAAKRLANPEARSVAFIGCGVQAHSHLDAFAEMFPLREIRAFGRGVAKAEALCEAARARRLAATVSGSAREAIEGADIVVTSVTLDYTIEPFLDARWLKPGGFATMTDLAIPWQDEHMTALGRIYVDDVAQERAMEKKMVPPESIAGDLASLVGGAPAASFDPSVPSAFVFRGMALGDLAVAGLAYQRAVGGKR